MPTLIPFIPYIKQDGTARVLIKVTHKGQRKYLETDIYVTKDDLTKKRKVRSQAIQSGINKEVERLRTKLLQVRTDTMTVDAIKDYLQSVRSEYIDFIWWCRKCRDEAQNEGKRRNYNTAINNLVKYLGTEQFDVNNFTYSFVTDYAKWIKGKRAPSAYLGSLKTMLNEAKLKYNDQIQVITADPFLKFKIKQPESEQRSLTLLEVRKLWQFEYTQQELGQLALDVWRLGFALAGMNEADLYTCNKIRSGVICYNRQKTKGNRKDKAYFEIRIEPEILDLVNKYRDPSGVRVFNFYKRYKKREYFVTAVNLGLKYYADIDFYSCRHSWATIARNNVGIDKYTVHEALNHVDESMRVTDIYVRRSFAHIWEANRRVLELTISRICSE